MSGNIYCLFISVGDSIIKRGRVEIPLESLAPPLFLSEAKKDFHWHMSWCLFVFN